MQAIILPDKCLSCKAPRQWVNESRAQYECGSNYTIIHRQKRLKIKRSLKCLGWDESSRLDKP